MADNRSCEGVNYISKCFNQVGASAEKAGKDISNALRISLNIDVSDALKGLKAVQREVKKTARALREVEESRNFNPVINITVNSNDDPKQIAEAVKVQVEKLSKEWM